jgi:transposase-like protein
MLDSLPQKLNKVIQIDEDQIQQHLGELVRGTVEETLNKLLDAEADQRCNTTRYERTDSRRDMRAGHYKRKLHTKAGEVTLNVQNYDNKNSRRPSLNDTDEESHRLKRQTCTIQRTLNYSERGISGIYLKGINLGIGCFFAYYLSKN